jgi:hypothetical protein
MPGLDDVLVSAAAGSRRWHTLRIQGGELSAARGIEAHLLLWLRFRGAFETGKLTIKVVR